MRLLLFAVTHLGALAIGFVLGIYLLPILTAPASVDAEMLSERASGAVYRGEFTRDLAGSDFLHWGEGEVSLSPSEIVHVGKLSPGPDYKLYLTREFVEDEAGFLAIKEASLQVGDVKTFDGVILSVPEGVDLDAFNTVVIWCEAFSEFITAARYRE